MFTAAQTRRRAGVGIAVFGAMVVSVANITAPIYYGAGGDAASLIFFRYLGFVALAGLWIAATRTSLRMAPGDSARVYAAGLMNAAGSGSLLAAFAFIPVSLAVLIFYTFPLMTVVIDAVTGGPKPRPLRIVCLVAALCGLALALGGFEGTIDWRGVGFGFVAALGLSSSYVLRSRRCGHLDGWATTFHMAVAGLGLGVLVATLTGGPSAPPAGGAPLVAALVSVLAFAVAVAAMFAAVDWIGARSAATVMNLEPVLTTALAHALLNEDLSQLQIIGACVVISAVIIAQRTAPE